MKEVLECEAEPVGVDGNDSCLKASGLGFWGRGSAARPHVEVVPAHLRGQIEHHHDIVALFDRPRGEHTAATVTHALALPGRPVFLVFEGDPEVLQAVTHRIRERPELLGPDLLADIDEEFHQIRDQAF